MTNKGERSMAGSSTGRQVMCELKMQGGEYIEMVAFCCNVVVTRR